MGRIWGAFLWLAAVPWLTATLAGDALGEERKAPELPALAEYVAEHCDFETAMWCRIEPRVSFDDVAWPDPIEGDPRQGHPRRLFGSFSTMTFDGRSAYLYGGGHATYDGNEVYAFDFSTLEWSRLSDPDPLTTNWLVEEGATKFSDDWTCPWPEAPALAAGHAYDRSLLYEAQLHTWPSSFSCGKWSSTGAAGPAVYGIYDLSEGRWVHRSLPEGWPAHPAIIEPAQTEGHALAVGHARTPILFEIELGTNDVVRVGPERPGGWQSMTTGIQHDGALYVLNGTSISRGSFEDGWETFEGLPPSVNSDDGLRHDSERFVVWDGGKNLYASTDLQSWQSYVPQNGPEEGGVSFNKFFHVPSLDLFVVFHGAGDVWAVRPSDAFLADRAALEADGFACSDEIAGWECPKIQDLVKEGGNVELPKGIYLQCATLPRPTTLDGNGSVVRDRACGGKAAFVVDADGTIRDVECSDIAVSDGNGACIRQQTPNLTLENVHFHDSQEGVLTDPKVQSLIIRDSVFERLGGARGIKLGRAHGVYYSSPHGELRIENSIFRLPKDEGHLVKSGAASTVILNSTLDEVGGEGSRLIDTFNGGEVIVRDSKLVNARRGNSDVIGYDYEARTDHPTNRIVLENVEADCAGGRLVAGRNSLTDAERIDRGNSLTGCR